MAEKTIPELPSITEINDNAILPIDSGTETFKITALALANALRLKGFLLTNAQISATADIAGSKLADNSITGAKIATGANIDAAKLTDNTITNAKINSAAAIAGSKIVSASASVPGVVTTGTQTFEGQKTFNGSVRVQGTFGYTPVSDAVVTTSVAALSIGISTNQTWFVSLRYVSGTGSTRHWCGIIWRNSGDAVLAEFSSSATTLATSAGIISASVSSGSTTFSIARFRLT